MKKCDCGGWMEVKRKYVVKGGRRYGDLPCKKRVYVCQSCQKETRTAELDVSLLNDLKEQYEERRQEWIQETSALKERIRWLKSPAKSGQKKIQKIRQQLIDMLDSTF